MFAGTPGPALPSLRALVESEHDVVAVLTRPDARAGRGRTRAASPVGSLALELGIPVLKPVHPSEPAFLETLRDLAPDVCPVVAYGALIPRVALDIPLHGWVNLHFSLLPAWRGAAPVQHAILNGDEVTGATTFLLEEGLDTGPVFGHVTEEIRRDDTAGQLLARLADSGAHLLVQSLAGIEQGMMQPVAQPASGATSAPKIATNDACVDWAAPALRVDRLIRACTPTPGAWTTVRGERLKLGPVRVATGELGALRLPSGVLHVDRRAVVVGTGSTPVLLGEVGPQGKPAMSAPDWARGARLSDGEGFGS